MKYLNSYKLFEDIDVNIISDCEDILLELDDEGFETAVVSNVNDTIDIVVTRRRQFYWDDVIDVFARLQDYLNTCGFKSIDEDGPPSMWTKYRGSIGTLQSFDMGTDIFG